MSQTELGLPVSVVQADSSWANSSTERWAPLVLCVAVAVAAILSIRPLPVGVFQDDGIYVALAKSLASGSGYRYVNLPGEPFATHYPPLYPAFLALLWKLSPTFPANVAVFKFANALLLAAAAGVFYVLTRRITKLSPVWSAVSVGTFTISAPTLLVSSMVLSEPLFLLLLGVALLAGERAASSGSIRDVCFAAFAIVVLAMCRTLGLVLLPALALILVWRRHWFSSTALVVGVVVGVLPWQMWVSAHANDVPSVLLGKYGSYLRWVTVAIEEQGLAFLVEVAQKNLQQFATHFALIAGLTAQSSVMLRAFGAVVLAGTLTVGFQKLARLAPCTAVFLTLYIGTLVLWPFSPTRFIYAIWPLIGIVFALGIQRWIKLAFASRHLSPVPLNEVRVWSIATIIVLNVVGLGVFNVRRYLQERSSGVEASSAERATPLAQWVGEHTQADDVVATDDDILIYLYTGRKAVPVTTFTAQEYLRPQTTQFIARSAEDMVSLYKPRYFLASTLMGITGAQALMQANPPQLRHIATLRIGAVFERIQKDQSVRNDAR